ncbi:MAG TPA: M3 family metallopeptidase [Planctomycetota bacterium]|nr:M3 family metallopeptidase [Planctomycetota bacterium]
MTPAEYVADLSKTYERLHTAKEDAFWTSYMGLSDDADAAQKDLDSKEIELKRFLQDPARLKRTREELSRAGKEGVPGDARTALEGWVRTFEAHVIDSAEARRLAEDIVELEGKLARARGAMKLGYRANGEMVEASSVRLSVMLSTDQDEAKRRAAFEGIRSIEPHVLANGFLEIVRKRNQLGRMLGGEDYYDWRTKRSEGLSKREIFALLDDLEARTRETGRRAIDGLRAAKGATATKPWNLRYLMAGDVTREMDPYFPFSRSFERWGRSFAALGISYRGAELVLDLVDRKGKYENGFMHGPVPAWRSGGTFRPARIHFTANAIPGMVGSGKRATETFFHEGGHAAHFANVDMPAPCFSQEFAPTSVAFAETQSMFLDSILGDADWQARYARTAKDDAMPFALAEKAIRMEQPYAAWAQRALIAICYGERAIYEIPDRELTAERVTKELRDWERKLLFVEEGAPRPTLSVPHLLAGESSAYYHGYTLALMAVHQTRRFFRERDGHLMDNRKIGPDLRRAYWAPGNSRRFPDLVRGLTGREVSPAALADHVNESADDAVKDAREAAARVASIPVREGPVELDARIRVVHGREEVANTSRGFAPAADAFARWIDSLA